MTIGKPDFKLMLGGVAFQDFEIPPEIAGGLKQGNFVHQYPGGSRTVDTTGPEYDPVEWHGVFLDGTAQQRANALNTMAKNGQPVSLTFGAFNFQVIVEQFTWKFQRYYQIPYTIRLLVITDNTNPLGNSANSQTGAVGTQGPSSTGQPSEPVMQSDTATANARTSKILNQTPAGQQVTVTNVGPDGTVTTTTYGPAFVATAASAAAATAGVAASVAAVPTIVGMTDSQINALLPQVNAAGVAIAAEVETLSVALPTIAYASGFVSGTDPLTFINRLNLMSQVGWNLVLAADAGARMARLAGSVTTLSLQ